MSNVAVYLVTRRVRHLAAFTRDLPRPGWVSGSWRPICGRFPTSGRWVWPAPHPDDVEARRRLDRALKLPVCTDCAEVAGALLGLVDDRPLVPLIAGTRCRILGRDRGDVST